MNEALMVRYERAMKKIGGPQVLISLPEPIKKVLRETVDMQVKVKMLEAIADKM